MLIIIQNRQDSSSLCCLVFFSLARNQLQHSIGRVSNSSSRTKYGTTTLAFLQQKVIILWWNDTSSNHDHVVYAHVCQFFLQGWQQGLVPCGLTRNSNHMDIRINSLQGNFLGSLKERTYINIKSQVGKSAGNHLRERPGKMKA